MSASAHQPAGAGAQPLFQVLAGNPTEEELAVLAAVVVGLAAAQDTDLHPVKDAASTRRTWTRRRQLSLQPAPGPGSWRRSYR